MVYFVWAVHLHHFCNKSNSRSFVRRPHIEYKKQRIIYYCRSSFPRLSFLHFELFLSYTRVLFPYPGIGQEDGLLILFFPDTYIHIKRGKEFSLCIADAAYIIRDDGDDVWISRFIDEKTMGWYRIVAKRGLGDVYSLFIRRKEIVKLIQRPRVQIFRRPKLENRIDKIFPRKVVAGRKRFISLCERPIRFFFLFIFLFQVRFLATRRAKVEDVDFNGNVASIIYYFVRKDSDVSPYSVQWNIYRNNVLLNAYNAWEETKGKQACFIHCI